MPAASILVVGSANFDYLVKGDALPRAGETVVGNSFHEGPGGKGANQAVAAARLGARVAFLGRVGADDRGKRCLAALAADQVDVTATIVDTEVATGIALVLVEASGEKLIMTAPNANARLVPADIDRAGPRFAGARVVLTQLEAGAATAAAVARCGRTAGALVVLDAGPPGSLPDDVLAQVDVVRCNAGEAQALTGIAVTGVDSARRAGQELRRRGAGAACIGTQGGDLLVFDHSPQRIRVAARSGEAGACDVDEVWLPHQRVGVVDTTGAGDAFAAGIAVGLAEGKSLTEAVWLGCVTSALKTTQLGAQALPRRAEVDAMLATIRRD